MSVIQPMPRVIAEPFQNLFSAMEDIVDQATEPVKQRLRAWAKQQSPQVISSWELPELIHAAHFTAASKGC